MDPTTISQSTGRNGSAKKCGLTCAVNNLGVTPDFDVGVLHAGPASGSGGANIPTPKLFPDHPSPMTIDDHRIYPKSWSITCSLVVFHTFPMGYRRKGTNSYARSKNGFGSFPYGEKHVYAEKQQRIFENTPDYKDLIKKSKIAKRIFSDGTK